MSTKTITITEDAYTAVAQLKGNEESFSELFLRLGKKFLTAQDVFGALSVDEDFAKRVREAHERIGKGFEKRKKHVLARFQRTN